MIMSEMVLRAKKRFVEGVLMNCMIHAGLGIVTLEYDVGSEEIITINFDDGLIKNVIVTGHMPEKIILDVLTASRDLKDRKEAWEQRMIHTSKEKE